MYGVYTETLEAGINPIDAFRLPARYGVKSVSNSEILFLAEQF
jgi:hypothetical protein